MVVLSLSVTLESAEKKALVLMSFMRLKCSKNRNRLLEKHT